MEQPALWLSTTYLLVKMAAALWAGLVATIILTRGQSNLGRSMAMAILSIPLAIQAWRVQSPSAHERLLGPVPPAMLWLLAALLGAVTLVDCLRRWLTTSESQAASSADSSSPSSAQAPHSTSTLILALVGLLITSLAIMTGRTYSGSQIIIERLALGQTCCWLVMAGVTIATTLELTLGKTGPALARQAWRPLWYLALLALCAQMVISTVIILRLRAGESIEDAVLPILYAIGISVVAYIVWAIPQRVVTHAAKPPFRDHLSLAIAGWIALMCLALTATLPADWPWKAV